MTRMNALWNCHNPNQGDYKKVLCVCSAGLLRSATIAWYLTKYTSANVRNGGIHDYALIPIDDVLITWADIIICSDNQKLQYILEKYKLRDNQQIYHFDLEDIYEYRNPQLIKKIEEKIKELNLKEQIDGTK